MKRLFRLAGAAALVAAAGSWLRAPVTPPVGTTLRLAPASGDPGFARALRPRPFRWPEDHGPHFDYQTEWWYYTGNLEGENGRHFGFQLTVFRRGLGPGPGPGGATLASNQVYLAHFALADVRAGTHRFFERRSRGAGGLAGASAAPLRVFVEDWSIEGPPGGDGGRVRLRARAEGFALDLELRAMKPFVAHGDRGLSAKGDEPGNASYYAGCTRLEARGTLSAGGAPFQAGGLAWFDHEWSTSALGPQIEGWDWFGLQLGDGREVMFYRLRRRDGGDERASGGTLLERDGRVLPLAAGDVQLEVLGRWTSPHSGSAYPLRWRLAVPSAGLDLELEPWLEGQEVRASFTYWEGAVRVRGTSAGASVSGNGYVELTGYAGSLQGVL